MPLFTIPASISKGAAQSVTLDKSALFALAAVSGDAFFSIQTNVKRAIVEYNSNPGNQKEYLVFDLSQTSPTATFQVSARARSNFLLERIVLEDFDQGTLIIDRADLPVGFDVAIIPSTGDNNANTATGLGYYLMNFSAYTGGWEINTVSHSVTNGIMTLNYRLKKTLSSGTFTSNGLVKTPSNLIAHRILLPAGYNFAGSVSHVQNIGSGTFAFRDSNVGSPGNPVPMEVHAALQNAGFAGAPAGFAIWLPTYNVYVSDVSTLWTQYSTPSAVDINFTATFPVVVV